MTAAAREGARAPGGELAAVMAAVAERGARGHSTFDRARFDTFEPHARTLWTAASSRALVTAYLEVVREGVALGYLTSGADPARPGTLLEHCVTTLCPRELGALPLAQAVALLAAVWNLCEGLAHEAEWMQRYVLARRGELTSLGALAEFLVRAIEPVITVPPPSSFRRDLAVSVLDARAFDDEFLPGALTFVAPTVLVVRDRRRPVELGVLLRHEKKSAILGPIEGAKPWPGASGAPPDVAIMGSTLAVAGASIELQGVVSPRDLAIAAAGFVVVTAMDSQRLWVVESR